MKIKRKLRTKSESIRKTKPIAALMSNWQEPPKPKDKFYWNEHCRLLLKEGSDEAYKDWVMTSERPPQNGKKAKLLKLKVKHLQKEGWKDPVKIIISSEDKSKIREFLINRSLRRISARYGKGRRLLPAEKEFMQHDREVRKQALKEQAAELQAKIELAKANRKKRRKKHNSYSLPDPGLYEYFQPHYTPVQK